MTTEAILPARYQIRKLTTNELDWAKSIITHSNLYNSPIWSILYPDTPPGKVASQAYSMFKTLDYHHLHGINSGHSYAVFDTEYVFKHPSSAATGGKLHWDFTKTSATGPELLEQMDFPLVHVALGYDAFHPMDHSKLDEFVSFLPELGILFNTAEEQDPRDKNSEGKKPKVPGEVIIRSGTATRGGYEGLGLAKATAHWYMKEKAKEGFRLIQIDSAARAVDTIWGHPPEPFTAVVTNSFETLELEIEEEKEDQDGNKVKIKRKPFVPADLYCARTVVTLRE
ncbi:hypothetical protein V8F06_002500 [Rhypophila decipiens]